ncbi:MAG: class I SAM-dependent methyltransferase [Cyclobacteriaceae bacterium]|nr:class I SAM-dependent methyltransferase [Cyclobacteriaceae bacterium]
MHEESHWNKIADKYEDEVLNAFESDKEKKLAYYFKKHSNSKHTAIDFGCGIGNGFHYLSPNFKSVLALDISQNCINVAKQKPFSNIEFKRMDLTKDNLKLKPVEFILCSNVAIFAAVTKNYDILRNVQKALKKNGNAIFVVPSLESNLFYAWRMIDWYRREGVKPNKIPMSEFDYYKKDIRDILQGIVDIDGRPTKHYSHSELQVIFAEAGLEVTAVERLEYDWNTEFSEPPPWMKNPYPWDWLIECRKPK